MENPGRLSFHVVVACTALLLLWGAARAPLLDPDEARYARTSEEMADTGDLVVPSFLGEPRPADPPLLHWVQSALFRTVGPGSLAARLPSVLATVGSLLLLGWISRRRFGYEGAAWSAAFLATMPLVVVGGVLGTTDALLAVHILGVVALDMAAPEETGPYRGAAIGALIGLAFLAKGPVGAFLPLLLILAGRTASGREVWPQWRALGAAVAAGAAVVLPWGMAFAGRVGTAGVLDAIRKNSFECYFGGSGEPLRSWYYAPVVLVAFLPWVAPLLVGMVRVITRWRDRASRTAIYAASALIVGLLFLSLGRAKSPLYLLPLAPLAALVVTWELGRELSAPSLRRVGPRLLGATLVASAMILVAVALQAAPGPVRGAAILGASTFTLAACWAGVALVRRRIRHVYGSAVLASWVFLAASLILVFPVAARVRSTEGLVEAVPEVVSGRPVVTLSRTAGSIAFYGGFRPEPVPPAGLARRMERSDDPLLVVTDDEVLLLPPPLRARLQEVGRSPGHRVYRLRPPAGPRLDAPGGRR